VDFEDTREEAAFRAEVRQWLGAHAEPKRGDHLEHRIEQQRVEP